jgi:hypothetical protein
MFDEASDINMHSNLNVFVTILTDGGSVRTLTLALVEISAGDSGSTLSEYFLFFSQMVYIYISVVFRVNYLDTVYGTLMRVLHEYQVPVSKVIGVCSDGASTMQGYH